MSNVQTREISNARVLYMPLLLLKQQMFQKERLTMSIKISEEIIELDNDGFLTNSEHWEPAVAELMSDIDIDIDIDSAFAPDPVLDVRDHVEDMLMGEVKEEKAELNCNARNPKVLGTVLANFGCCLIDHVDTVVEQLVHKGRATTHDNHHIRLMVFGSVDTGDHLEEHWGILRSAQFKYSSVGLFMVLKKARLNMRGIES